MAQVDAGIPLGIRPVQIESPLNQLAQVMQIQNAQQSNEMNRLTMDERRRGVEETNRLNSLFQSGADAPALRRAGFHKQALEWEEKQGKIEREKIAGDKDRSAVENQTVAMYRDASQAITDPQSAAEFVRHMHTDPRLKDSAVARIPIEQALAKIPQDPAQLAAWKQEFALGATKFMEMNKPQFITSNTGGQTVTTGVAGLTGQTTPVQSLTNTQSPDNAASNATSRANNQATVGASYANAAATREVAKSTRDAAQITADSKRTQDTEMKLADDYRTESKGFAETSTAMKKVLGAIDTADKNPGSALAAGTAFMKLLDPNSVVRESELGMALNASGWFDRATNIANTLQNGRTMTAEQQKNLRAAARDLFEEAKAAQREVDAAYRKRATDYKLDPARVITDRGQNGAPPAKTVKRTGTAPDGRKVVEYSDGSIDYAN